MHCAKSLSLLTDLYELTMMQGYYFKAPEERGAFYMFYRRQPFGGGYAVFAGLAPLLHELQNLRFGNDDLNYLGTLGLFRKEFLHFLKIFRFSGSIYSIREGTAVFPNEPIIRVEGTLMETQLIESIVLNQTNFQTLIATKASRITESARGIPVMEFGLRRAHGVDGALSATRASYIGGASSTSNTLAGKLYGIPVSGTMAHSWVMSFPTELESFEEYARLYPDKCIFLVDTYDTLKSGIPNAIHVFNKMKSDGTHGLKAVRIDSGDFEVLINRSREMLDQAGHTDVKIIISSDMDEWSIARLIEKKLTIDAWGVGTKMVTAWGDPALTGVYKISAHGGTGDSMEPCIKLSDQTDKTTLPGILNVLRFSDHNDIFMCDCICLENEMNSLLQQIALRHPIRVFKPGNANDLHLVSTYIRAESLIEQVMSRGNIIGTQFNLDDIRARREKSIGSLDRRFKRIDKPDEYPVYYSEELNRLKINCVRNIELTFKS